jgi:WD40 repeat protein
MFPPLAKRWADAQNLDPAKTHLVREFKQPSPLIGCRIDPSGRFIFAGAQDNGIHRWELATGKKTVLVGHKSWVRGLAFSSCGNRLFSGDYAGRILSWSMDAEKPTPLSSLDAHHGWVRAVAVSGDGKTLASAGNDNLVKLWSCPEGKLLRVLEGHACHVYNVAFHPQGKELVSADLKGIVKQWNVTNGAAIRDLDAAVLYKYDAGFRADIGGIRSMAFSADGSLLACAGITNVSNAFAGVGGPMVVLFEWATGKRKQLLIPKEHFQGTAWGVAIHPARLIIGVGGGSGGALWFWKPEQQQAFFTLKLPTNARDLSLHPDGKQLAIAFADGAVRIYRMTAKFGKS